MRLRHLSLQFSIWFVLPILVLYKFGFSILTALLLPAAVVTLPLLISDIKSKLLPNRLIYPAIILTVLVIIVFSLWQKDLSKFGQPVGRALLLSGVAFVLYIFSKGNLGAGDVKLYFLLGLDLGVFTVAHIVMSTLITLVSVIVVTLALLISRRANVKTKIAFGPYILLGCWSTIFLFG